MRYLRCLLLAAAAGCAGAAPIEGPPRAGPAPAAPLEEPVELADPFVGTGGHGHTFPGATVPFGMVQLSPDTRLEGWDGCSGYHGSDTVVYGFSHTHLSGTGCSDYGDVLLVPGVGEPRWKNGADGTPGYRSRFRKETERAQPGYYAVRLDDPGVLVELTATARVGVHRYTFPATDAATVLLDLAHRDEVIDSAVEVVGDREVRGFRRSKAWARDQHCHFVARFSMPFASFAIASGGKVVEGRSARGKDLRASLRFAMPEGGPVVVKVGISGVDEEGAARNLDAEVPGYDFDAVRAAAREAWRGQLGKIEVRGGTLAQRRTFYSALYHCCVAPNAWSDEDGRYRGRDFAVHRADGWTQYTVFSLWDTFRAEHPLLALLEPGRTNDFLRTFLAQFREGGALPVWELSGNETDCMIGYHAVPVIADAWAKGLRGCDADAALAAMVASADRDWRGLSGYRRQGFVDSGEEGESVSKTLEYAYDDWCIAETARTMGREEVARRFYARSQAWRHLFDPSTGFFRPKVNQAWIDPFDPAEVNGHFTEANAWQYSLFVPHDMDGLIAVLGGRDALAARLDRLFGALPGTTGNGLEDISGQIGQYAHGNEPSHAVAYLYDFAGQPWKTQQRVREVMDTLYSDRPDGLCGNEDCGQMSAWFVFSALGFYPVTPGRPEYAIGTPLFPSARIRLPDGGAFTVDAPGDGPFVQRATLDGAPLRRSWLSHEEILRGGRLVLEMGGEPSRWGSGEDEVPRTSVPGPAVVPVPFVAGGEGLFRGSTEVVLAAPDPASRVLASFDGGRTFAPFEGPVRVESTTEVQAFAAGAGGESPRIRARFRRLPHGWSLRLGARYAPRYSAGGDWALVDGVRGRTDWWTGGWQGYEAVDVDATVDLGAVKEIGAVRAGFLHDQRSWIFLPLEVRVLVSEDGTEFRPLGAATFDLDEHTAAATAHDYEVKGPARARFVRVVGKSRGDCPSWHPGAGHHAWLFVDEIQVDGGD